MLRCLSVLFLFSVLAATSFAALTVTEARAEEPRVIRAEARLPLPISATCDDPISEDFGRLAATDVARISCNSTPHWVRWEDRYCQRRFSSEGEPMQAWIFVRGVFECGNAPARSHAGRCLAWERQAGCVERSRWMGGGHDGPRQFFSCDCGN